MINKQEFFKLVRDKVNQNRKDGQDRITLDTVKIVLHAVESVIYDTVTKGQNGVYGLHYPSLGKIQTVYCPEKQYYDLNEKKYKTKEAHCRVKVTPSENLLNAPIKSNINK